jgi:phage baseplate assembly protein W
MSVDRDILGVGWGFPLGVNGRGSIRLARGEDDVAEAIRLILGTAPGERRMRPEFGCNIHDFVFAPIDAATTGMIRYHVLEALGRWEPRIEVKAVRVRPHPERDGCLLIELTYTLRAIGDERNLVYPFYTIPEESAR